MNNPPFAGERGARPLLRSARLRRGGGCGPARRSHPRAAQPRRTSPRAGRGRGGAALPAAGVGSCRLRRAAPSRGDGNGGRGLRSGKERSPQASPGAAAWRRSAAGGNGRGGRLLRRDRNPRLQSAGGARLLLCFRAPPLPEKLCGAARAARPVLGCLGASRAASGRSVRRRRARHLRAGCGTQRGPSAAFGFLFPALFSRLLLCDAVALWCLWAAGRAVNSVVAGKKPLMTSGGDSCWNSQSPVRTLQPIRPLVHSNTRPLVNGRKVFCAFIRYFSLGNFVFWVDSLIGSCGFAIFFIKTASGEDGVLLAVGILLGCWGGNAARCGERARAGRAGRGNVPRVDLTGGSPAGRVVPTL